MNLQVRNSNTGDSYTEIVVPRPGEEDAPTTTTVSKPLYGKIRYAQLVISLPHRLSLFFPSQTLLLTVIKSFHLIHSCPMCVCLCECACMQVLKLLRMHGTSPH